MKKTTSLTTVADIRFIGSGCLAVKITSFVSALFVCLCIAVVSFAADARIGGYDVRRIAISTMNALEAKKMIGDADVSALSALLDSGKVSDSLAAAQPVVKFYEKLGSLLVEKKVLVAADVESAKAVSAASGGVKAEGLNPIVLAASFLDAMSKKGIISIGEAQAILDSAKSRGHVPQK